MLNSDDPLPMKYLITMRYQRSLPPDIYLLKVKNRNSRKRCGIMFNAINKTPVRCRVFLSFWCFHC